MNGSTSLGDRGADNVELQKGRTREFLNGMRAGVERDWAVFQGTSVGDGGRLHRRGGKWKERRQGRVWKLLD